MIWVGVAASHTQRVGWSSQGVIKTGYATQSVIITPWSSISFVPSPWPDAAASSSFMASLARAFGKLLEEDNLRPNPLTPNGGYGKFWRGEKPYGSIEDAVRGLRDHVNSELATCDNMERWERLGTVLQRVPPVDSKDWIEYRARAVAVSTNQRVSSNKRKRTMTAVNADADCAVILRAASTLAESIRIAQLEQPSELLRLYPAVGDLFRAVQAADLPEQLGEFFAAMREQALRTDSSTAQQLPEDDLEDIADQLMPRLEDAPATRAICAAVSPPPPLPLSPSEPTPRRLPKLKSIDAVC